MLLEHNLPVYQELCETLEKYRKAIVVVHTGGGKSYIANEFLTEKKLNALVVCPKRTICDQWRELNPEVTAVTYNYFSRAPMEELLSYECVVLDEAHHCGSPVWGKRTKEFMEATTGYVIGLTADSRRWSDGAKDVAETVFDGHLVRGPDLKDAIEQEIIREPLYVCTVIGLKETVRKQEKKYTRLKKENKIPSERYREIDHTLYQLKLDAESIPSVQETLKKYIPQNPKGIVFVNDIAATEEAAALMADAFPDLPVYIVHTKQPESVNQEQMAAFSGAKSACIISVDMLGEGVHVEGVNFVVMLRRTQSPTVFFQQLGRTTVINGTETPVIIDVVGNNCTLKSIEARECAALGLFQRDTTKKGGQFVVDAHVISASTLMERLKELLSSHMPWTEPEKDILRKFYPSEGADVAKRIPGRTVAACRTQAKILGLAETLKRWTNEEDEILRKYFRDEGPDVAKRLPGRTKQKCYRRAKKLGLEGARDAKPWTPEEDEILKEYWPTEGKNVVKRLPGRTASACKKRTLKLKLPPKSVAWTAEERAILKKYWATEGTDVAERLPGRTKSACKTQAQKLILPQLRRVWTEEEDAIERKYYPTEGAKVAARLPGRTKNACWRRAQRLGLLLCIRWSAEEDAILKKYYPIEGSNVVNRLPGRTEWAVQNRVSMLKIRYAPENRPAT